MSDVLEFPKRGLTGLPEGMPLAEKLRAARARNEAEVKDFDKALAELGVNKQERGRTYFTAFDTLPTFEEMLPNPCGLPFIDDEVGGGLRPKEIIVFVGKPGAGKTGIAAQIALKMASRCCVACLWIDESSRGSSIRYAQQLGFSRDEFRNPTSKEALEESKKRFERCAASGLPFHLPETGPYSTLEAAYAFLREESGNRQPVLIVDSLQTARVTDGEADLELMPRMKRAVDYITRMTRELGAITIVLSHANVASWADSATAPRRDPLAAGKGGADLPHAADLQFELSGSTAGTVRLRFAKNRNGNQGRLVTLRWDPERARFREETSGEVEAEEIAKSAAAAEEMITAALRALGEAEAEGPIRADLWEERVGKRKKTFLRAKEEIRRAKWATASPTGRTEEWRITAEGKKRLAQKGGTVPVPSCSRPFPSCSRNGSPTPSELFPVPPSLEGEPEQLGGGEGEASRGGEGRKESEGSLEEIPGGALGSLKVSPPPSSTRNLEAERRILEMFPAPGGASTSTAVIS
ncbi:MAG: AAA family ATPase [Thermoanaerobaculia bacterium]